MALAKRLDRILEQCHTRQLQARTLGGRIAGESAHAWKPPKQTGAVVYLWARQSELAGGLETRLHAAVKEWIGSRWPFKRVGYPDRDIAWDVWRGIPEE